MKARRRLLGCLILMVGGSVASCGGDDDMSGPSGTEIDAGSDGQTSGPDAGHEAAADTPIEPPRNDASIEADAVSADTFVPDTLAADAPPLDAPTMDASDAATVDGSWTDEAGADANDGRTIAPPADADAAPPATDASADADAGSSPDGRDAGPDVSPEAAGDSTAADADAAVDAVSESLPDVTEEPILDASLEAEASSGGQDDAADSAEALPESGDDAEGSTQELVRWQIEADPPECSADPSKVACTDDGAIFQVRVQASCPTVLSEAFVWFPAGAPPELGSHVVLPVANIGQAFGVTGNQVAIEMTHLGAPVERWSAQLGTVDVELDGNRRIVRFTGVTAFLQANHATTTALDAFLICGP